MPEVLQLRSLQRRVALVSAVVVGTALVIGAFGMELLESFEHEQMLDARLKHLAGTILHFVDNDPAKTALVTVEQLSQQRAGGKGESIYDYQVWATSGSLLQKSPEASTSKPLTSLTKSGFDSVSINGEMHRVFSLPSPGGSVVIQVAEPINERGDDVSMTIGFYLVTLLLPFGFSMGATWLLLRRSFHVLNSLAVRMNQHPGPEVGPLTTEVTPKEFAPVVQAVNSLLHRTGQSFVAQQRFISMAAHEIRTPWAGVRAQAQAACNAQSQEEIQIALQSIVQGVDRASHVFDQLCDLTRVQTMQKNITSSFQRVQLAVIYRQVLEDLGNKAAANGISIVAQLPDEDIQGLDFAIYLLLRNLIANAILYTPEGGQIEVAVKRKGQEVILTVDDSGKGIPADARSRAFEPFNRLGRQGPDGVGLGLFIVAQIVDVHRAEIQLLDSPLGGLRVQVIFNCSISNGLFPLTTKMA